MNELNALLVSLNEERAIEAMQLDFDGPDDRGEVRLLCESFSHPLCRDVAIPGSPSTSVGTCICGEKVCPPLRTRRSG